MSRETIKQCWIKAKIRLESVQVQLDAEYGRVSENASSPDVQEIATTLQRPTLNVHGRDLFYVQARDRVTTENISKWATIEMDESARKGIVKDAMTAQNFNAEAPVHSLSESVSTELN